MKITTNEKSSEMLITDFVFKKKRNVNAIYDVNTVRSKVFL